MRLLGMLEADVAEGIESLEGADLIAIEKEISCLIGMSINSEWNRYGVRAAAAVAHAEAVGGPVGAVIAAGLGVYGPPADRSRACAVLDGIRSGGADLPAWIEWLGAAEPIAAHRFSDEWDEYRVLVVDYARPDGSTHELFAGLHPFGWGMAHDLLMTPAGECGWRLRDAGLVAEEIGLEEARDALARGMAHLDEALKDWWDNDADMDSDVGWRTLVAQRIELLPSGDADSGGQDGAAEAAAQHIGNVVRGFVAQPVSLGEREEDVGQMAMAAVVFSQACRDSDVLRWTPPRIEAFIERFLPMWQEGDDLDDYDPFDDFGEPGDALEFDEEQLSSVDSAFPRWLRFVAEYGDVGEETLEANLAAARSSLRRLRVKVTGSPIPQAGPQIRWD